MDWKAQPEKMAEKKAATNVLHRILTFVAHKRGVMQGSDCVAVARSHTMAKRIANALNIYRPKRKGC